MRNAIPPKRMFIRIIAFAALFGAIAGQSKAERDLDPVCFEQAKQFVEMVPNLERQTGIGTGPELVADTRSRWGLAAASFAHATSQFAARNGNAFWARMLVLSDGLIRCFGADRSMPHYAETGPAFETQFPIERRIQIITTALQMVSNGDQ